MMYKATPANTIAAAALHELRQLLGARLLTDPLSQQLYSYDAAMDRALPAAVALPQSVEEVVAIIRLCVGYGVPVVPRGAGTSLCGGPIPTCGSLVLSLTGLARILEICPQDQCAVVQPGVVNLELQRAANARGYFYAPDPASQQVSTLGGNLGHNAGGPRCLKYGVTANHILAVEMVSAAGDLLRLGSRSGGGPGYDLLSLVTGGEGTLGVVTEITCRLLPLPETAATALAIFEDLDSASQTVSDLIAHGMLPAALELIDQPMIHAVEKTLHSGYPLDAAAVLLIELEGLPETLGEELASIQRLAAARGARQVQLAHTAQERELLWRGRRGTAAAVANLAPGKQSTDVVVPRQLIPQMVRRVAEIGRRYDLLVGNVLHAGDGNLHPQIVFDPRDADQVRRLLATQEEIIRAALELGGGMTGEHGVGTEKRRFMPLMFGAGEMELMRRVRRAFDPQELLNPGKLLPDFAGDSPPPPALPAGDFAHASRELVGQDAAGRLQPLDYEACGKLLALAARERQLLLLRGSGSASLRAEPGSRALTTVGLHRVLQVQPDNLTATVQAGVRLRDLHMALAAEGLWWPVLPPRSAQGTVGGALGSGYSGLLAARYGRLQDLLTGVRLALPCGETLRFGIPCVKNVAGYALERLVVGSRGTLCLILEATLRLLPLPAQTADFLVTLSSAQEACRLASALLQARSRPTLLELLQGVRLSDTWATWSPAPGSAQLAVSWRGPAAEVAAGEAALREVLPASAEAQALEPGLAQTLWTALADAGHLGDGWAAELLCPPSRWGQAAECLHEDCALLISPALGTVRALAPEAGAREARDLAARVSAAAQAAGGWARRLLPTPGALAAGWDAPALTLHRRLKAAFDPEGILPTLCDLSDG